MIYIALFSLFLSEVIFSLYYLAASSTGIKEKVFEQEEVNFVFHQIENLLDSSRISQPILNASSTELILSSRDVTSTKSIISILGENGTVVSEQDGFNTVISDSGLFVSSLVFNQQNSVSGTLTELHVTLKTNRESYTKTYVVSP